MLEITTITPMFEPVERSIARGLLQAYDLVDDATITVDGYQAEVLHLRLNESRWSVLRTTPDPGP